MKTRQRWRSLPQVISGAAPIRIDARRERAGKIKDGTITHTDYDEVILWFDSDWSEGAELFLIRLTDKNVRHLWVQGMKYYQNQSDRAQAVRLMSIVARKFFNNGMIGNLNTGWLLTDINYDQKSNGHWVLRTGTDVILDVNNGQVHRIGAKIGRMFARDKDERAWNEILKMFNRYSETKLPCDQ